MFLVNGRWWSLCTLHERGVGRWYELSASAVNRARHAEWQERRGCEVSYVIWFMADYAHRSMKEVGEAFGFWQTFLCYVSEGMEHGPWGGVRSRRRCWGCVQDELTGICSMRGVK